MNKESKVGIVTTNWNSADYTVKFVYSLRKLDYTNWSAVIVNNDPKENHIVEKLKTSNIRIVNTNQNLGYSGGINRAIRELKNDFDFLLIINNDVNFTSDFLYKLVEGCNPNSIVSPVVLYNDTEIVQNTGGKISTLLGGTINLNKNKLYEKLQKVEPDFLSGCCMFMDKDTFEKVGYFDEEYGSYFEDVDYCYRAQNLNTSLKILWYIKLYHHHSVSTKGKEEFKLELLTRNTILFARKNLNSIHKNIFIVFSILRGFVINIFRPSQFKYFISGIRRGLND